MAADRKPQKRSDHRAKHSYPSDGDIIKTAKTKKSIVETAKHYGIPNSTFKSHLDKQGIYDQVREAISPRASTTPVAENPLDALAEEVHTFLKKQKRDARLGVFDIADKLDLPPSRVRDALGRLREQGYRIPDEEEGSVALQRLVPDKGADKLHKSLLEGDELTIGLVSDTHLSSNEEALAELHLAYDLFQERGITEVWNAGDLTCGRGIFRTQDAEIKHHTFETQVEYLRENYPEREGIHTLAIGGNHDLEGEFGRIGADPVEALSNCRSDIKNLGPYSAWVELPNGAQTHLLHGRGGMSYAYSYKAQKLVDGYAPGRKPALLCVGHWHVSGWLHQRGVNVVFPGCFEWRSPFLERLGLSPAVGFWILNLTLGDDGSLVKFVPEWHQFFEGRVVAAKG